MENEEASKVGRVFGIIYLTIGVIFTLIIPDLARIFKEILTEKELTGLTEFIIYSNPYLWLTCGYFPGVIFILSDNKRFNSPIFILCFSVFLFILGSFTIFCLFRPLCIMVDVVN